MNRKNYLYSSGEFAKLTGVNKRTLHYYNEIGLFRPEIIGENGYHYYTCFQFTELELILTLRKIGLSIDEIKDYSSRPSDESFTEMMTKKKKLIDESIEQLLSAQALKMAKEYAPFVRKIEIEVETLDMVKEAVEAGADIIMLDNMTTEEMQEAIRIIDGRAETECSGNVTKENIARLTGLGVDYISSGALTHSSPILDISMKNLHPVKEDVR